MMLVMSWEGESWMVDWLMDEGGEQSEL